MGLYQNDGKWMFSESLDWKEENRLRKGLSLDELQKWVAGLIAAHGKEATFTLDLSGDDYDMSLDIERPATEAEIVAYKAKREAEAEAQRKRTEEQERAEYEKLRAKFEGRKA